MKAANMKRDRRAEQLANRDECTRRYFEAYIAETDREFAEEFYGEIIRERYLAEDVS